MKKFRVAYKTQKGFNVSVIVMAHTEARAIARVKRECPDYQHVIFTEEITNY